MSISIVRYPKRWIQICSDDFTTSILASVQSAVPAIGFSDVEINARSLQVEGTMALIMGRVDSYIIHLVGRYRSRHSDPIPPHDNEELHIGFCRS